MIRFFVHILLMLLTVSCVHEEVWENDICPEDVEVSLNLAVAGEDVRTRRIVDPETEGAVTAGDVISNFWVLQYDGTGDAARLIGEPQYYPEMTDRIRLVRSSGKNRVVIIANTFDPLMTFPKESDYSDLKKRWMPVTDTESFLASSGSDRHIIFAGSVETEISGNTVISCPLKRNVAKVSIRIVNSSSNVTVNSWQIRNVPSVSYLYTDYDLPSGFPPLNDFVLKDFPTFVPDAPLGPKAASSSVPEETEYIVYLPVNKRGQDDRILSESQKNYYAPNAATYLQVNASYDGGVPIQYTFYLGANLTTDFNLLPNHSYSYEFNITAKGDADADTRVKELGMVDFTESERANCYVINPAQTEGVRRAFKIPVDRVDKFWGNDGYENNTNYTLGTSKNWEVRIIAANFDNSDGKVAFTKNSGTGKNDYFEFTVAPGTVGNAIVALYAAGNNQVCWSWHLWITDYAPDEAYAKTPQDGVYSYSVTGGVVHRYEGAIWKGEYAGRFIMDRNLGAWNTGYPENGNGNGALFYQFGRKDPLFGRNSVGYASFSIYNSKDIDPALTMAYSVQNPLTFISTDARVAWTTNENYNPDPFDSRILWQDKNASSSAEKSIFDPCPPGYCVPKSDAWADFRSQQWAAPTTNVNPENEMKRGFPQFLSANRGCYYWPYPESGNADVPDEPVYYPASGVMQNSGIGNHYGLGNHVYVMSSNPKTINNPWLFMANQTTVGGNTGLGRAHAGSVRCITVRDAN